MDAHVGAVTHSGVSGTPEAYKRIEARYLNSGLLRNWARMAQLCPTMVANDLLIAEAAVLYDRRGDLIGEEK